MTAKAISLKSAIHLPVASETNAIMSSVTIPSFIDQDFLYQILKNVTKDGNVQVLYFHIEIATSGGENYSSDIYRIKVKYSSSEEQRKTIDLVLKHMKKSVIDEFNGRKHEFDMYLDVLPKMEAMLTNVKLVPKCFLTIQEPEEVFVFEDLNALGYQLGNRIIGLDEEYSRVVMRKIGVFHAASIMCIDSLPHFKEILNEPLLKNGTRVSKSLSAMILGNMAFAAKTVDQWTDFKEISKKLHAIVDNFDDKICRIFDAGKSQFNVINHGDLWVNNILFRYTDNAPTDAAFIDFEHPFYGSPGHDINFFLNTSVQLNVLQTKRYDLLRDYFTSLKETLQGCGYPAEKIPTWQMLIDEVRRTEYFGMYALLAEFPIIALSKDVSAESTFESFKDSEKMEEHRRVMFANSRIVNTIRYGLDRLNELAVLDE